MAMQIKTIKQQINSVGDIKKITKTMELVSVAKMKKAVAASLQSREYAKYALEILKTLARYRSAQHPLLEFGSGTKTLLVIIASNKGLCGSYNMNVSKAVHEYKLRYPEDSFEAITIGKQADKVARRNNIEIVASFHELGEDVTLDDVVFLRKVLLKEFLEPGKYKRVLLVYTEFIKQLQYKPLVRKILPVSLKITKNILEEGGEYVGQVDMEHDTMSQYLFEPSEERVLEKVIPSLVTDLLLIAVLESLAAEHSSRMMAMKSATENATELVSDLLLTYNRARQANITQDVAEIIAGAEALHKE